jgi:2-dehydropantoate 2-reductase
MSARRTHPNQRFYPQFNICVDMRVAVMGAGGQGILFGSLLVKNGHDVTFIARGKNLKALRKKGFTLKSKSLGDITGPAKATDEPKDIGKVDLVFFCVKTYDLEEAAYQIKPIIGPDTIVLTIQNGVEAPYKMGEMIGHEHVLAGVSRTNAHLMAPGEVHHFGGLSLTFGELSGMISPRVKKLEKMLKETGLNVSSSKNIKFTLWRKLTTLCGLHGVLCLTRSSLGVVKEFKETWELMRMVMLETASVARAEDVFITEAMIDTTLESLSRFPSDIKPSMLVDLEAGRRIEIEIFNGAVVRLGRQHGIDTPYNYAIYAALKPYENGVPTP